MKDITVKYEDGDYKICCSTTGGTFTLFKVYALGELNSDLRYLYGNLHEEFVTITLTTEDNKKNVEYFHDEIIKLYKLDTIAS